MAPCIGVRVGVVRMRIGVRGGGRRARRGPGPHPPKPSHHMPSGRRSIGWRSTPRHRVLFTSLPRSTAKRRFEGQQTPAVCPSGQREQTVNLPAQPSQVRILAPPHWGRPPLNCGNAVRRGSLHVPGPTFRAESKQGDLSHAVARGSRGWSGFGPGREAGVLPCRQRRPSACSYLRCSGGERQWTNPRGDSEDNRLSRARSPPWQKAHERVLRDVLAHIGAYRLSVPGRPALEMHACHAVVSSTQSAIFSSSCTAGLTAAPGPIADPPPGFKPGKITICHRSANCSQNPSASVFSARGGSQLRWIRGGYMRNTAVEHLWRRELDDAMCRAEWVDATPHRAPVA